MSPERCPCGQLLPDDDHPVREIDGITVITCPLHPPGKLTVMPNWPTISSDVPG